MTRSVTAFTAADRLTPAAQYGALHRRNPSFVSATRALVFGGYAGQVNVTDLGDDVETHWFDDYDVFGQADADRPRRRRAQPPGRPARADPLLRREHPRHLVRGERRRGDGEAAGRPEPLCKTGSEAGPLRADLVARRQQARLRRQRRHLRHGDRRRLRRRHARPRHPRREPARLGPGRDRARAAQGHRPAATGPAAARAGSPPRRPSRVKALQGEEGRRSAACPSRVTCAAACSVKATLKVKQLPRRRRHGQGQRARRAAR